MLINTTDCSFPFVVDPQLRRVGRCDRIGEGIATEVLQSVKER